MGSFQNQESLFLMLIQRETTGLLMFKDSIAKEKAPEKGKSDMAVRTTLDQTGISRIAGIRRKNTFNLKQVQDFTLADDLSRAIVGHLGLLSLHSRPEQIRNLLCLNKIFKKNGSPPLDKLISSGWGKIQGSEKQPPATIARTKTRRALNWEVAPRSSEELGALAMQVSEAQTAAGGLIRPRRSVASHVEKWRGTLGVVCA